MTIAIVIFAIVFTFSAGLCVGLWINAPLRPEWEQERDITDDALFRDID